MFRIRCTFDTKVASYARLAIYMHEYVRVQSGIDSVLTGDSRMKKIQVKENMKVVPTFVDSTCFACFKRTLDVDTIILLIILHRENKMFVGCLN